jgi:very-short-patch-repair endonuclease
MARKIELSSEQLNFLKEQYPKLELTLEEIAENLSVSVETVRRRAKKLGLERPKFKIYGDNLEWLKSNYNKTYSEMSSYLNVNEETIRVTLKRLGLKRTTKYRPFKIDMNDREFLADLENPRLTAPDIVEKYKDKYGIGESRIHQLRRERDIKLQVNTLDRESSGEKQVREILDNLDIAYIKEKRIGKFHIDFYLGFKGCIEVQGSYWHSREDRKSRDIRKKKYLEGKDYKVLYIWDNEMDKAEESILKFVKELGLPV